MLRPYQQKAVSDIKRAFAHNRRVLFVLPTGAGKTFTFAHMALKSVENGKNVMLLAHRRELIDQIERTLADVGCIGAHVDTVQTVARRVDKVQRPDFIIVDEAHHAVAGQWRKIIDAFPDAFVLGVTATPCRLDGSALGDVFDEIIFGPTMRELIGMGNLVPSKAFVKPAIDKTQLKTRCGDYSNGSIDSEFGKSKMSIFGDIVQMYRAHSLGKKAVIFTHSVAMARESCELMESAGYRFRALYGDMPDVERRQVVDDLRRGDLDGIASCDIVSEGFDCPALETAILLRPTKSLSLYLQQVGRVLRPAPGKSHGLILDHVGNVQNFGLPEEDREWNLEGTGKQGGTKDPDAVKLTTCKECFLLYYAKQGNTCPYCGYEKEPEHKPVRLERGELVEYMPNGEKMVLLTVDEMRQYNWIKTKNLKLLRDYKAFAKSMGRKEGWGWHLFKMVQKMESLKV